MGLQLATMLEKSGKLEVILDLPYYDDYFAALVAEINADKYEETLNKTAPNLPDDCKCVHFKALSGLGAGTNKFPLLDHFGIPVENIQNL